MHGREYGFFYFNLCAEARGFDAQHHLLAGFALTPGLRSPFLPSDELHSDTPEKSEWNKTQDGARQVRKAWAETPIRDEIMWPPAMRQASASLPRRTAGKKL